jgi:hypothetical protein
MLRSDEMEAQSTRSPRRHHPAPPFGQTHPARRDLAACQCRERSCLDLAQQLQALESVIHNAKRTLIQDHMEHCIGDAVSGGGLSAAQALREFKALSKYL